MPSPENANSGFVTVAKVGTIPEGEGRSFQVGERLVAVFLQGGQYFAIDDLCPHMGASLGAGYLDEEGIVTCPWHAWRFCVRDGKWADNPRLAVDTFQVRVVGNEIQVRLAPPEEAARHGDTGTRRQADSDLASDDANAH
ncbi:MAG TPA: Rieske 2Fe-2S domain-containing protein [Lacipirellulaceae bacterium]|nr:Rieske 2Fe-2S domain-containing protein [Lacipirellulaceae bacterium]